MPCSGPTPDYLCLGWREKASQIRTRDGDRCRGCNRSADLIHLEVHHRIYGKYGSCGNCILTGVSDDDLVTLCIECHDSITDIRRKVRYGHKEPIQVVPLENKEPVKVHVRLKEELPTEFVLMQSVPKIVVRRTLADILGKD